MRAGIVEGEQASHDENLYAWRDRVSALCETTMPRTTTRRPWWHPARCLLSPRLCGTLSGKFDALCHGCGIPCALAPLGTAYCNGCHAFVCHCGSMPRPVGCTL